MEIIDTHCHLDVADFDLDRPQVLERCRRKSINKIVIPAIQSKTWTHVLDLCKSEKFLYPALGLHPVFLEYHHQDDINKLEKILKIVRPIAIGEIGLDFYIKELDHQQQIKLFE